MVKRLIVDQFMPLGYRLMLEKQQKKVCQRISAREYAARFTHIIIQLPDYMDKQIIVHSINGLKILVRNQVISHDPIVLEKAIRLAENMDDRLFAEQITL